MLKAVFTMIFAMMLFASQSYCMLSNPINNQPDVPKKRVEPAEIPKVAPELKEFGPTEAEAEAFWAAEPEELREEPWVFPKKELPREEAKEEPEPEPVFEELVEPMPVERPKELRIEEMDWSAIGSMLDREWQKNVRTYYIKWVNFLHGLRRRRLAEMMSSLEKYSDGKFRILEAWRQSGRIELQEKVVASLGVQSEELSPIREFFNVNFALMLKAAERNYQKFKNMTASHGIAPYIRAEHFSFKRSILEEWRLFVSMLHAITSDLGKSSRRISKGRVNEERSRLNRIFDIKIGQRHIFESDDTIDLRKKFDAMIICVLEVLQIDPVVFRGAITAFISKLFRFYERLNYEAYSKTISDSPLIRGNWDFIEVKAPLVPRIRDRKLIYKELRPVFIEPLIRDEMELSREQEILLDKHEKLNEDILDSYNRMFKQLREAMILKGVSPIERVPRERAMKNIIGQNKKTIDSWINERDFLTEEIKVAFPMQ